MIQLDDDEDVLWVVGLDIDEVQSKFGEVRSKFGEVRSKFGEVRSKFV